MSCRVHVIISVARCLIHAACICCRNRTGAAQQAQGHWTQHLWDSLWPRDIQMIMEKTIMPAWTRQPDELAGAAGLCQGGSKV